MTHPDTPYWKDYPYNMTDGNATDGNWTYPYWVYPYWTPEEQEIEITINKKKIKITGRNLKINVQDEE
jgi:hypothetical protein